MPPVHIKVLRGPCQTLQPYSVYIYENTAFLHMKPKKFLACFSMPTTPLITSPLVLAKPKTTWTKIRWWQHYTEGRSLYISVADRDEAQGRKTHLFIMHCQLHRTTVPSYLIHAHRGPRTINAIVIMYLIMASLVKLIPSSPPPPASIGAKPFFRSFSQTLFSPCER